VAVPPGASPVEGKLSFLDNQVDRTTGTIRLLATFPNEDRSLWPGQFVQVQLRVDVEAGVVLVPSRAVQSGQDGDYVFVVGGDGKVAVRKVRVARTTGESSVVAEGLEGSETVVTEGQLRLVPGTRVESKPAPPESASR
jgi:multidrug efflux system membrane fusion protein